MDPLASLNAAQRTAVTTLTGPLLVLAGAGTGKTRVITYRMAELIRRGTPPAQILSVTFTNKAAREMRERATALLGRKSKQRPVVSTFHSYCARVLREEIEVLGYPRHFAIYDRGDQESAARTALRDIRVTDAALKPGDLLAIISKWKTAGITPERAADFAIDSREFLAAAAYRRYVANLRGCAAIDFDDLLLMTSQIFKQHPDRLEKHQRRFQQVQIDEYQDTNALQFDLIELLVRPHHNLCVVGDDDQSIYGWRGADVSHILGFQTHFPKARVVRLQDNYRCTNEILDLANRVVRHNKGRHEKTLVAHKVSKSPVRFLEFPDENAEAEGIVREIRAFVQQRGVSPGDYAILFRTNEQPRPFEEELRRVKLPYHLVGGQSFFDRREVRDAFAYLKAIAFPSDEVSLLRIINVPSRGISSGSVERLTARAVKAKTSIWAVVSEAHEAGEITSRAAAAIGAFHQLLQKYRGRFSQGSDLAAVMTDLLHEVDYQSEIRKQYKEEQQQESRINILGQVIDSLRHHTERNPKATLANFLEECALSDRQEENDDGETRNAVKLMTLHAAKGLEFPRVFLVGMEEGLLPHKRSIEMNEDAIAEERRLCYVGITRAMDSLAISRAEARSKWGRKRPTVPSRFLFEMRGDAEGDPEA